MQKRLRDKASIFNAENLAMPNIHTNIINFIKEIRNHRKIYLNKLFTKPYYLSYFANTIIKRTTPKKKEKNLNDFSSI